MLQNTDRACQMQNASSFVAVTPVGGAEALGGSVPENFVAQYQCS